MRESLPRSGSAIWRAVCSRPPAEATPWCCEPGAGAHVRAFERARRNRVPVFSMVQLSLEGSTADTTHLADHHLRLAALHGWVLGKVKDGGQVVDQLARVGLVVRVVEIPDPEGVLVVVPGRDDTLAWIPAHSKRQRHDKSMFAPHGTTTAVGVWMVFQIVLQDECVLLFFVRSRGDAHTQSSTGPGSLSCRLGGSATVRELHLNRAMGARR